MHFICYHAFNPLGHGDTCIHRWIWSLFTQAMACILLDDKPHLVQWNFGLLNLNFYSLERECHTKHPSSTEPGMSGMTTSSASGDENPDKMTTPSSQCLRSYISKKLTTTIAAILTCLKVFNPWVSGTQMRGRFDKKFILHHERGSLDTSSLLRATPEFDLRTSSGVARYK